MRRLYVSTGILQNAIKFDGEGQLEVLAFCVQAKRIYVNSIIYNPSIRNLMKVFRLGYGRLTKTPNKCIADGWAHYDEKNGHTKNRWEEDYGEDYDNNDFNKINYNVWQ